MRWAVNYAIDRNQIVNVAYEAPHYLEVFFPAYAPLNALVDARTLPGYTTKPGAGP